MNIVRLEPNQNIWFTSDTHYNHSNIVRGVSKWADKTRCRDFDTVEEMNTTIVNNINAIVKENDILFHLGDWSFGGNQVVKEFRDRVKCKNVHLIKGNHDIDIDSSIFSSVNEYAELTIFGHHKIILCHYPMRSWNNSNKGSIMLFGHTHGNISDHIINGKKMLTMDVGMDCNNLKPFSLKQILKIMQSYAI